MNKNLFIPDAVTGYPASECFILGQFKKQKKLTSWTRPNSCEVVLYAGVMVTRRSLMPGCGAEEVNVQHKGGNTLLGRWSECYA